MRENIPDWIRAEACTGENTNAMRRNAEAPLPIRYKNLGVISCSFTHAENTPYSLQFHHIPRKDDRNVTISF
jgi:hypothetical protein